MNFLITVLYIGAAILILLFMITIHELGHYIAGKLLGFKINEFAIGMGKALYKHTNPKTGEVFSLRIFPIGGYCAFAGDEAAAGEGQERTDPSARKEVIGRKKYSGNGDFNEMPPWKRLIVLFAGAFANFLSAIIFAILLLMIIGYTQVIEVKEFKPHDTAYAGLLQEGDKVIAFNGEDFSLLDNYIRVRNREYKLGEELEITFIRDGNTHKVSIPVEWYDVRDENDVQIDRTLGTGMTLKSFYYEKMSFGEAVANCVGFCFELSWLLLGLLWGMVSRGENLDSVAGTTGTVAIMAQQLQLDPVWLFILVPFISVNLAVFNLLPIPALDGARMVFVAAEWIRGKPINQDLEAKIHFIGLIVMFGLVIVADIAFWVRGGLGIFEMFCTWRL